MDILGLGLIALGVLLGGVAYAGWDGGTLGNGAVTAMRFVLGALGYVVPGAMVVAGGLVLARELRPPARPLRTGVLCLVGAITLALAAGTLGVGPGALHGADFWRASLFEDRGGIVGQAELWVTSHLISTLGADILAVFLFVAGVILVTGAGVAGVVRATRAGVAGTTPSDQALERDHGGHPGEPSHHGGGARASGGMERRAAVAAGAGRAAVAAGAAEPLLPPERPSSCRRSRTLRSWWFAHARGGAADLGRGARSRGGRARDRAARAPTRGTRRSGRSLPRGPHPTGPLPGQYHRRSQLRLARPVGALPGPLHRRCSATGHGRAGAGGGDAASRPSATSGFRPR